MSYNLVINVLTFFDVTLMVIEIWLRIMLSSALCQQLFFTNYAFRNSLSHNNTPIPRLYECVRRDVMGCLVTM